MPRWSFTGNTQVRLSIQRALTPSCVRGNSGGPPSPTHATSHNYLQSRLKYRESDFRQTDLSRAASQGSPRKLQLSCSVEYPITGQHPFEDLAPPKTTESSPCTEELHLIDPHARLNESYRENIFNARIIVLQSTSDRADSNATNRLDAPQVKAILFDGDDDSDDNGPGKPSGAS